MFNFCIVQRGFVQSTWNRLQEATQAWAMRRLKSWLGEVRGRQPIGSALRDAKLEVLIQLSLVASFSVVTVIVPLVACLEALLDFRGDAWCLVRATRRPIPQRANTIGEWNRQVRVATYISILIQAGVVAFASSWLDGRGLNRRLLCFFAVEHCLQALYLFVILMQVSFYTNLEFFSLTRLT